MHKFMHKFLLACLFLVVAIPVHAVDPKTLGSLDQTVAVADGDLVPIWDVSQTGDSKTRSVLFSNFRFSLLSGISLAGTSGSTLNVRVGGTLGTAAFTAARPHKESGRSRQRQQHGPGAGARQSVEQRLPPQLHHVRRAKLDRASNQLQPCGDQQRPRLRDRLRV